MLRTTPAPKNSFYNNLFEYQGLSGSFPSKGPGKVLPWPTRQTGESSVDMGEIMKADRILRKLSLQLHQGPSSPGEADAGFLLSDNRGSQKKTLHEEMPAAIEAYILAISSIKEYFSALSVKKTFSMELLEEDVGRLVDSLERNHDALLCIAHIYRHKVYIYTHAVNVCIYASAYALNSGKSCSESVSIGLAGLMHDTGMAFLPLALLQSTTELSPTEQIMVKYHPIIGCDFLSNFSNIPDSVFSAVLEHHERFDGSGYPAALAGSGISFVGHLVSVCSAFDAMTASRRHKKPVSAYTALGEIFLQRDKQFHPTVLESFIKMVGIYPVGSVVVLRDGYSGIVTASSRDNPTRPVVTLVMDPQGQPMPPLEFDMSQERLASITQCVSAAERGLNVHAVFGIPEKSV